MKSLNLITCVTIIGTLLLSGCSESRSQKLEQEITNIQQRMSVFEQKNDFLERNNIRLEAKVDAHEILEHGFKTALLDPSSKGYQRIDTASGFFLISLKDIRPYLNGYKLILHIGNPSSATYSGFTLKTKWGRKFDSTQTQSDPSAFDNWEKSLQQKEAPFTEEIKPASWNKIEFIISPAKSEELGYLELSMETNIVKLFE